jgi:DNA repair protein RadA/Sms
MAKTKRQFVCQECGNVSVRWEGKCSSCGKWNTYVEESVTAAAGTLSEPVYTESVSLVTVPPASGDSLHTAIAEFDRIVGGGLVAGQVILIGGDPGIGKSTILLQVANRIASEKNPVLYASGEESAAQARLRSQRLQVDNMHILVMAETNIRAILKEAEQKHASVLLIDSIQVMYNDELTSAPGSVSQVRECAAELVRFAKKEHVCVILVGHVTKTGSIAGPRVVEHLVDTVLYFEGERHNIYRILRAVKNRYGSTDEIGVFEMTGHGLVEVPNPSAIFLAQRQKQRSGSAVGSALEGTRPILLEVQSLVATSPFGTPSRKTVGVDVNRITMLLAVLEKRIGIHLNTQDVFVNLAGGVKINEPGLDLACVAAIASSFYDRPVDDNTVIMGEVGLGGEVRAVSQIERRVMEARRLGFNRCILPAHNLKTFREKGTAHLSWQGVDLVGCEDVATALQAVIGDG